MGPIRWVTSKSDLTKIFSAGYAFLGENFSMTYVIAAMKCSLIGY